MSSIRETPYSVENNEAMRVIFDPVVAFRTPYRIDRLQSIYFVIEDYQELYDVVKQDIAGYIQRARTLSEYSPSFSFEPGDPNIHIFAC